MTPFSHGFNMHIISAYQMRGNCRRELWAVAMLPKWNRSQGMEALQPGFLALSRRLIVPRSHCQGGSSACCAWKPAQKCHKTKQKHFLSNSTTRKSPLPSSGNNTDLKTSVSSSNDKIVYSGEQKKNLQKAFASSMSPFSKDMDVIKFISCSRRRRLKLDFLQPYTEVTVKNSCLPENGWTTHYSSTLMTELIHSLGHDADVQCGLPVFYPNVLTQLLTTPNLKNNKRRQYRKNSNCSKTCMTHINCSKTFSTSYRNHILLSCWLRPDLSKKSLCSDLFILRL